jgi:phage repressor protein C with HTH and peptisase S24 domain
MQLRLQPWFVYFGSMEGLDLDTALVRALTNYAGTHVAGVAKKARISPSTLQRPANGTATTRLSQRTLEKLQAAYPNFPGWAGYSGVAIRETQEPDEDLVPIREIDLTFGMGSTYLDVPITEEVHRFPRGWLRRYTRASPERLFFAQGLGDSMEPTLYDSDLLLIDTSQRTLNMAEKIWAVAYADCGMIKRLRPVPGGGVEVLSDKREVSSFIAYDDELQIIGRVVAVQRKL